MYRKEGIKQSLVAYSNLLFFITEEKILHLRPDQEKDKTYFTDKEVSLLLDIIPTVFLLAVPTLAQNPSPDDNQEKSFHDIML